MRKTTRSVSIWCSTTPTASSRKAFRESLHNRGLRPRKLHPRSPNLNAYVERWIQSIQVECLDHFIVLGAAHLNHLVQRVRRALPRRKAAPGARQQVDRARQATADDESIPSLRQVVCRQRLGGLLKHYGTRGVASSPRQDHMLAGRNGPPPGTFGTSSRNNELP